MAIRAIWVAGVLSILPIAGCGTVANLVTPGLDQGGKTPFGGVRQDMACYHKAANGEPVLWTHSKTDSEQHQQQLAPMILAAVDLPFSFIGDVVTYPYTASYTFINEDIPLPPMGHAPAPPTTPGPMLPPQDKTGMEKSAKDKAEQDKYDKDKSEKNKSDKDKPDLDKSDKDKLDKEKQPEVKPDQTLPAPRPVDPPVPPQGVLLPPLPSPGGGRGGPS